MSYFDYMNAQIVFRIDPDLKEKAMQKAKRQGLPLAFILKMLLKAYVEGDFEMKFFKKKEA